MLDNHKALMANAIRKLSIDAIENAQSGHPGLPLGCAEIAVALFTDHMCFDVNNPRWINRDRFVLSAGHGSMLLYSLLYLLGYKDITLDDIKRFRTLQSSTAGHPEFGHIGAIETTTGPLGQGLANAVGMAIAEQKLSSELGNTLIDHHTYVLVGDGDLMEGISQEAISLAGHLALHKLIILFDDNGISIDGHTSLTDSTRIPMRFEASGFDVQTVDGHDVNAVSEAIKQAKLTSTPSLICCKTTIGFGSPNKSGSAKVHGAPLGKEETLETYKNLNLSTQPFEIDSETLHAWRQCGHSLSPKIHQWHERLNALSTKEREHFDHIMQTPVSSLIAEPIKQLKQQSISDNPALSTRIASQKVLEIIGAHLPNLIGGSADLTGSNNTKLSYHKAIQSGDFSGQYLHYGIREHGMAAIMNGLALHGGIIPYGGTFLVFSDYCRPAIRLSALMRQRVIYVFTHDSIGLGEDGPTHQPVEHLASLRLIPHLYVLRPADIVETAECWQIALENENTPSALILSRQTLPFVSQKRDAAHNICRQGAYIIRDTMEKPIASIFASGSEVSLALQAADKLAEQNIAVRVVSVPCFELFEQADTQYQQKICGTTPINIAIEAALPYKWERFIGSNGHFIGMEGFGASAKGDELFRHFGITVEEICQKIRLSL